MPKNKEIKFSYNWNNKLDCNFFTTIRLYNPIKYQIGHIYDVSLKGEFKKQARLVEMKKIHHDQINAFIAGLDTGYSVEETKKILERMYKGKMWLGFILLETIKEPTETPEQ